MPDYSNLTVLLSLPKDSNQWRRMNKNLDEWKYVIYNDNINALMKTRFGVVTAYPNDPNPTF